MHDLVLLCPLPSKVLLCPVLACPCSDLAAAPLIWDLRASKHYNLDALNSLPLPKLHIVWDGISMRPNTAGNPLLKLSLILRALWVLCTPVFCPIPASPGKSPSLIGLFVTPSHSSHPGCRVESALHHFPRRYRQMSRYGSQTPSWTFCHNQGSSWFKACIRIRRHDEAIHAVV